MFACRQCCHAVVDHLLDSTLSGAWTTARVCQPLVKHSSSQSRPYTLNSHHEFMASRAPLRPAAVEAMPDLAKRTACAELRRAFVPQLQRSWIQRPAADTSTDLQAGAVCHGRRHNAPSTHRDCQPPRDL